MFNFKALLIPRVLRFFFISLIRIVGIVAICMVIGAEIHEVVRNIQGYSTALKAPRDDDAALQGNSSSANATSLASRSAGLSAAGAAMSQGIPATTSNGTVSEQTFYAFAAESANATASPVNSSQTATPSDHCGYVHGTTVPDHDGGIFFSTLFRILNVFILLFLLVSEIAPPIQRVTTFYIEYFHPLSEEASTGFLGVAMIWVSTSLLSSDVQTFAIIAAWLMFVVGVFNVLFGLIMGPSVRSTRAIFSVKSESILPTTKRPVPSYPSPKKMDIGFPAPAHTAGGFDFYPESSFAPPSMPSRPSEMIERSHSSAGVYRARSGKGVVTIKTKPDEVHERHSEESSHPPSYRNGQAI